MAGKDALGTLCRCGVPPFRTSLESAGLPPLRADGVRILQMNVGRRCNLACRHCHVEAGPDRKETMPKEIFDRCLEIVRTAGIDTVDVTGGAPEMNPHLEPFLDKVSVCARRVLVRSNLVILLENEYARFIDAYVRDKVELVCSLPSYDRLRTDRQRGDGFFDGCVRAIRALNARGYGRGRGLVLDVVSNPVGAFLPASQQALEDEYRRLLKERHDVEFDTLFSLTNLPVGRYLDFLIESGNYESYMRELLRAFNPAAVDSVMCRTTVSVGWDGRLYDCDFNQMLSMPIDHGAPDNVMDFDIEALSRRLIVTHNHCYGCTAGAGSSCQGETAGPRTG